MKSTLVPSHFVGDDTVARGQFSSGALTEYCFTSKSKENTRSASDGSEYLCANGQLQQWKVCPRGSFGEEFLLFG